MAIEQEWEVPGSTDTDVEATDFIAFSDGTFGNSITVDSFNDGTHVRSSAGADNSDDNTPNNVKYVAAGTGDWGDGTENIDQITDGECNLSIEVTYDSNITVTDASIFAYDGTTESTAPTNTDVYCFESGDAAWTNIDGSAAAMDLEDRDTPATSHTFYMGLSVKPTAIGTKDANAVKFSFTYQ